MKKISLWGILIFPILLFANGLEFQGDGYIDLSSIEKNLDINENMSIDSWFKSMQTSVEMTVLSFNHTDNRFCINVLENKLILKIVDSSGNIISNSGLESEIIKNRKLPEWHHLAIQISRDKYTNQISINSISINGNPVAIRDNFSNESSASISPIYLGSAHPDLGTNFIGGMDEIRVWSRLLAPSEIQKIADFNPIQSIAPDYFLRYNCELQTIEETESEISVNQEDYPAILHYVETSSSPDVSLPVSLLSFNISTSDNYTTVEWSTDSEIENTSFQVLRSSDNINYENLYTVDCDSENENYFSYTFYDNSIEYHEFYYKLQIEQESGLSFVYGPVIGATEITSIVENFSLGHAYPNPFNPTTNINFSVPEAARIEIKIFDLKGNLVKTLTENKYSPGHYLTTWNATDINNRPVSTGTYIYQMISSTGFTKTEKMVLVK